MVYTVLRLATPTAALALVALRPDRTREVVEAVHAFGMRNKRFLVTGSLLVVGLSLAAKGLAGVVG